MQLIQGLLVLLLFQCLGEALKAYFQWVLPGPVLGMLLLFLGMCLYRGMPASVGKASQALIPLLALMFLPAATGLFFLGPKFADQWPAIIAAVVIGSFLSLLFNALLMRWLSQRNANRHNLNHRNINHRNMGS